MKIYQTTTIQYLTAETAGAEAGWYAVEAGMSPDQDGAVRALSDLGEGLSAAPVILNAASQEAALPAYLNAMSATYVIEDDFAPAEGYRFDAKQAADIYNSVEFADGLTVAVATVTEYTSGASYSHSALTLTMTAANGQNLSFILNMLIAAFHLAGVKARLLILSHLSYSLVRQRQQRQSSVAQRIMILSKVIGKIMIFMAPVASIRLRAMAVMIQSGLKQVKRMAGRVTMLSPPIIAVQNIMSVYMVSKVMIR